MDASRLDRRAFLQHTSGALLTLASGAAIHAADSSVPHVFFDPTTRQHEPPADHPESPKRVDAVMAAVRLLEKSGRVSLVAPQPATEDDLRLVHTPQYVAKVRAEISAGRRTLSTG